VAGPRHLLNRPGEPEEIAAGAVYLASDDAAFVNVASPAIWSNHLTAGFGYLIEPALTLNLAYYQALKTRITGPFLSAAGPVPGTAVSDEQSLRSLRDYPPYQELLTPKE